MARTGAEAHSAKMGRRASAATPMGSRERASHPTAEMVIEQPPLRGKPPVLLPTSVRSSAQTISPTVTTEAPPRTRPPIENCESRVVSHVPLVRLALTKELVGLWGGVDRVVPVRMEPVAFDVHGGQFPVGDLDPLLVAARIEARVDLQPGTGRRRSDQVDDHLQALQRLAAPVQAHVAEHAMLDFVPLRRSRREMADADRQPDLVGELLQLDLPQTSTAGVAPAAVGSDRQRAGVRVALAPEVLPPRTDRADRERARVVADPDRHHAFVRVNVVDAVRDRVPEILVLEVVAANLDRPPARLPLPPDRLEITDQLALLGIDRDRGLTHRKRAANGLIEMPKLRVTIGLIGPLPSLDVRVQPKPQPSQQLPGRPIRDLMPSRHQRARDVLQALGAPPQRRARITTRIRIHQPLQIPDQRQIRLSQPRTPRTDTTNVERS